MRNNVVSARRKFMSGALGTLVLSMVSHAAEPDGYVLDGFKGCMRAADGAPVCRSVATGAVQIVSEGFYFRFFHPSVRATLDSSAPSVATLSPRLSTQIPDGARHVRPTTPPAPALSESAPPPASPASSPTSAEQVSSLTTHPVDVSSAAPGVSPRTPAEIYERASKSIVYLLAAEDKNEVSQGSGVVVRQGIVATNCHVVEDAVLVGVFFQGSTYRRVSKIDGNDERDLCLLRVENLPAPPIQLGSVSRTKVGERVYAIGSPRGLELTITEGLISGLRTSGDSFPYLQTSAPISAGSSGGALVSERGELLGITSFIVKHSQNLNFAAPVDWLLDFAALH